jgi:hypothetical protein
MAQKETLSSDYVPREESVISWNQLRIGRDDLVVAGAEELKNVDVAKFMEEEITIVIHKSTDKNALERVPVGVNGETAWLPRDTRIKLPRKFVERLARAQEATFRTDDNPDPRMDEGKIVRRTNGQVFPFQVIHDPNPRGAAWLQRISREG